MKDISQPEEMLSPTFEEVAEYLKAKFSPQADIDDDRELIEMRSRSPMGEMTVIVQRRSHYGNVYLQVDIWDIGLAVAPLEDVMVELINEVNGFGAGGVLLLKDTEIVFRQSIAIQPEHLNCWKDRLRFMLMEGMRMAINIRLYITRRLGDLEIDAVDTTIDSTPFTRSDPSLN